MALETVTYLNDLNASNPAPNDPQSQGDDHIRNIKKALLATFPTITGPITKTLNQINRLVSDTRQVNSGDGLNGGGDLTANRTISVDSSVVRTSRQISAGDGLTGGGNLGANRSLAVDGTVVRNPATVVRTDRLINTGGGLQGGGDLSSNKTLSVDGTVARTSTSVSGGAGLTGGGTIGSNRTISMGTPSSIGLNTTNNASGNTHTHELPAFQFRAMMANHMIAGALGSIAFAINTGGTVNFGGTTNGNNLYPFGESDGEKAVAGASLSGTWMCLGYCPTDFGAAWIRIE